MIIPQNLGVGTVLAIYRIPKNPIPSPYYWTIPDLYWNQGKGITLLLVPFIFAYRQGDELMCDWNNNGKYDMEDAFISYHIHKSILGNKQNQSSPVDSGDVLTKVLVALLILGILIVLA